jgi:small subunit ribosomal protein S1
MTEEHRDNQDKKFRPEESFIDEELQRELDKALGDMSLEDILDTEEAAAKGAEGGLRKGKVIAIQGEDVFVDMGGKNQGVVPLSQFEEEPPKEGDVVELLIDRYDENDGLLLLSRQGAVRAATWETLEEGQIVEGRVTGHNKGGLELVINGIRAFMPISQIEMYRVEDLSGYANKRLHCQVVEVDERAENVIVSHRALLELEAAQAREKLFETLQEGETVTGVVRNITPYGAFVDIGGADGLLHVSDMSYRRVEDPRKIVEEGQRIEVKVLSVDRDERKIALGLKQIKPDPWADAAAKWAHDSVVTGRVTRLAEFGAFVELEEGVEGLIPMGELSFTRRIRDPGEVVNIGDVVKVRVMNLDTERKRIGLSLKRIGDDPWMGASVRWGPHSLTEGIVTRIVDYGAFVELTPGVEGLIHISELSYKPVRKVTDLLQEGNTVQVRVLSVDEDNRRISLSIKELGVVADSKGPTSESEPPSTKRKRKKPLKGGLD